jgi:hypothetical protein
MALAELGTEVVATIKMHTQLPVVVREETAVTPVVVRGVAEHLVVVVAVLDIMEAAAAEI